MEIKKVPRLPDKVDNFEEISPGLGSPVIYMNDPLDLSVKFSYDDKFSTVSADVHLFNEKCFNVIYYTDDLASSFTKILHALTRSRKRLADNLLSNYNNEDDILALAYDHRDKHGYNKSDKCLENFIDDATKSIRRVVKLQSVTWSKDVYID